MKLRWIMSYNPVHSDDKHLEKLSKWLNIELPGIVLFALSFFYNLAFYAFLIIALLFTPYLIYVLTMEKRFGWIVFFTLFVAIPGFLSYYFFTGNAAVGGYMLAGAIPMALYLFYCYLLKLSIPGMLDK